MPSEEQYLGMQYSECSVLQTLSQQLKLNIDNSEIYTNPKQIFQPSSYDPCSKKKPQFNALNLTGVHVEQCLFLQEENKISLREAKTKD